MARQIIKNPQTGKFQVFSSISDTFILEEEITREVLAEFWRDEYGRSGMDSFDRIMAKIDNNEAAYYQFTKTWDRAVAMDIHHSNSLNMINQPALYVKNTENKMLPSKAITNIRNI